MDDNTETPSAGAVSATRLSEGLAQGRPLGGLSAALAGLQAGMLGAIWMLAWLGIDSSWGRRGFWNNENLFATAFYGDDAIRAGFSARTLPGLALYLIIYSLLGFVFALILRNQFRPLHTLFAALFFALAWFYVSFHILWKSAMPLVYLLYADRPMVIGHLIYGACLARFPAYLPGARRPIAPPAITHSRDISPQKPQVLLPDEDGAHEAMSPEMPAPTSSQDGDIAPSAAENPTTPHAYE